MISLDIEYIPTSDLLGDRRNARTHSDRQVGQIARSIEQFGFNNPILIDDERTVVAGHGRLAAAQRLNIVEVPTIRLSHLSPAQRRAYMIADNRIAELSGWDREILALEFRDLVEMDLDFELSDTGFEIGEIDLLLEAGQDPNDTAEDIPVISTGQSQAQSGDLWQLGDHLLFCGDALDPVSYRALLGHTKVAMTFTDPPYNVKINGHVSGLGKAKHREFAQASGEMSGEQFKVFLEKACQQIKECCEDGALSFVCMDWRHIAELVLAGLCSFSELKNICVWVKPNGGMGSLYRSRHELVAVFKAGKGQHRNNVQLGVHGRYRTNVWEYDGLNSFQQGRDEKLSMHPTVKPVGMIADAIMDCTARGEWVLDPFAGSGSTIIAAERVGRRCAAIELDTSYVDVCLQRYALATGVVPVNLWTGEAWIGLPEEQQAGDVGA